MNRHLLRLTSFIVVLAVWQTASYLSDPIFVPRLQDIVGAFLNLIASGELISALGYSLSRMMIGYVLALVTSIVLGLVMGYSRRVEYSIDYLVGGLYVAPLSALIPILILWFGIGDLVRIFYIFIFIVFDMTIIVFNGARNMPPEHLEVARSFNMSQSQILWKVFLPAEVPFLFTAIRIGLGRAVRGMVVAELLIAVTGLGDLIMTAASAFKMAEVLGIVLVLIILGATLSEGLKKLHQVLIPWARLEA
ncbi:MAG: ABC transporter permease [Candidatus Binatia bacterium]